MPRVTFATVRRLALALPDVEESTMYGAPAFRTRGQMFVCRPTHRSAEANSIVARLDFEQRDEMIRAEPETYYLKDHYVGYPCVLARLSAIHPDALAGLLHSAHAFVSRKARRSVSPGSDAATRGGTRAARGRTKRSPA